MQTYDLVMLGVLVTATLFGAWKGLAWQIASLASIFVSYLVALKFRVQLAERLPMENPWNIFTAMLVLYLGTSLAIWTGFQVVKQAIDRIKLKEFDRQAGALLGLAKGVVLCMIITFFALTLMGEQQREQIVSSRSGHYIARIIDKAHAVMPEEVHDVLHPYMHSLDEKLHHGGPLYDSGPFPAGILDGTLEELEQGGRELLDREFNVPVGDSERGFQIRFGDNRDESQPR